MKQQKQIQINYQGKDFLLDIVEGNLVNLNSLYEIAGSPINKDPYQWSKSPITQQLAKSLLATLNVKNRNSILKAKKGAPVKSHWQLAVAYAKYLAPEFHLAVNQVFKERLEESIDPELGITRSRQRAMVTWERQGKPENWIEQRLKGIFHRNVYTATLKKHGVESPRDYANCTNSIYKPLLGGTARDVRQKLNLPEKANVRDHLAGVELAALGLAEALATEHIESKDCRGGAQCEYASNHAGLSVKKALDHARLNR